MLASVGVWQQQHHTAVQQQQLCTWATGHLRQSDAAHCLLYGQCVVYKAALVLENVDRLVHVRGSGKCKVSAWLTQLLHLIVIFTQRAQLQHWLHLSQSVLACVIQHLSPLPRVADSALWSYSHASIHCRHNYCTRLFRTSKYFNND